MNKAKRHPHGSTADLSQGEKSTILILSLAIAGHRAPAIQRATAARLVASWRELNRELSAP